MQAPWLICLVAISDKFVHKLVHMSCYLFWKCVRKMSKELEIIAPSWQTRIMKKVICWLSLMPYYLQFEITLIDIFWEPYCIYIVIFDTNINYVNLLFDQNLSAVSRLSYKKSFKLVNFQPSQGLPFESSIQSNLTTFWNLKGNFSRSHWFTFCFDFHNYQKISSTGKIFKPSYTKNYYGKNLINVGATNYSNKTQHQVSSLLLKTNSLSKIKSLLSKEYIRK